MESGTVYVVCFSLGLLAVWAVARAVRLAALRRRARERLDVGSSHGVDVALAISRLTGDSVSGAELATYSAVTAAEFAWSWASIDPSVIQAADFSSAFPIHSGLDFAQYIHSHYDALGPAAQEGFLQRLLGYVGEQQAADLLSYQGHLVEVAGTANQPIWDLLIDGYQANVKTVSDIASIKAEAAAHPGVTYLVPEDAHGHAVGNILPVAGFKHEIAKESIKESLAVSHGEAAIHGLFSHLPWITIAFAAYRNIKAVRMGREPAVAWRHGAIDVAGRGLGVLAGAKTGAVLGGAVGGPLGALFGAMAVGFVGAVVGGMAAENYKRRPLRDALDRLQRALHDFGLSFAGKVEQIRARVEAPMRRMERHLNTLCAEVTKRKHTLRWIFWPDFATVLLDEAALSGAEKVADERRNIAHVGRIIDSCKATGRYERLGLLMASCPPICQAVGYNASELETVRAAQQSVFHERKQLDPTFQASGQPRAIEAMPPGPRSLPEPNWGAEKCGGCGRLKRVWGDSSRGACGSRGHPL